MPPAAHNSITLILFIWKSRAAYQEARMEVDLGLCIRPPLGPGEVIYIYLLLPFYSRVVGSTPFKASHDKFLSPLRQKLAASSRDFKPRGIGHMAISKRSTKSNRRRFAKGSIFGVKACSENGRQPSLLNQMLSPLPEPFTFPQRSLWRAPRHVGQRSPVP